MIREILFPKRKKIINRLKDKGDVYNIESPEDFKRYLWDIPSSEFYNTYSNLDVGQTYPAKHFIYLINYIVKYEKDNYKAFKKIFKNIHEMGYSHFIYNDIYLEDNLSFLKALVEDTSTDRVLSKNFLRFYVDFFSEKETFFVKNKLSSLMIIELKNLEKIKNIKNLKQEVISYVKNKDKLSNYDVFIKRLAYTLYYKNFSDDELINIFNEIYFSDNDLNYLGDIDFFLGNSRHEGFLKRTNLLDTISTKIFEDTMIGGRFKYGEMWKNIEKFCSQREDIFLKKCPFFLKNPDYQQSLLKWDVFKIFPNELDKFLKAENLGDITQVITGHRNKAIVDLVYKNFIRGVNSIECSSELLKKLYYLKKFDLNRDIYLRNASKLLDADWKISSRLNDNDWEDIVSIFHEIKSIYNHNLSYNILAAFEEVDSESFLENYYAINDIKHMIKKAKSVDDNFLKKLKKKTRGYEDKKFNLGKIHDECNIILLEYGLAQIELQQANLYKKINGKEIKIEDKIYEVVVPLSGKTLVDIGTQMNMCVGTAGYDERINNNESRIIALKSNKGYEYCAELNLEDNEMVEINQFYGYGNSSVGQQVCEAFDSFIIEHKLIKEKQIIKFLEQEIESELDNQSINIPLNIRVISVSGEKYDYNWSSLSMKYVCNNRSPSISRKIKVSENSPSWWDADKDSLIEMTDGYEYYMFLEGKYQKANVL